MESRRRFLKKTLYMAPVIMTVAVRPAFAGSGYTGGRGGNDGTGGGGPNISSPPGGGGGGSRHAGGHKDAHDWWSFWRKL